MKNSAFIIRYAGAGVTFRNGACELVQDHLADRFPTDKDAWYEAYRQGLNPARCDVVPLADSKQKAEIGKQKFPAPHSAAVYSPALTPKISSHNHDASVNYAGGPGAGFICPAAKVSVALGSGKVRTEPVS
jgi:hypothetical protein